MPQVFATCCTFYVPLFVILVLYWKIYQTARKRIRRRRHDKPTSDNASQVSWVVDEELAGQPSTQVAKTIVVATLESPSVGLCFETK